MAHPLRDVDPSARLANRLQAARRTRLVGRDDELALFRTAISAAEPPFVVLYVYGPGGVGKTTLVKEWGYLALDADRRVIRLDLRNLEPTPEVFLAAFAQALGKAEGATAPDAGWPSRGVLILDSYESVATLDPWLRDTFLPQLSADTVVVIAGRQPPAAAWSSDIEWAPLTRILPLRNLGHEEVETYLAMRGIPSEQHADVLAATYGHPLAMALAADALMRHGPATHFRLGDDPDIVRVLLESFVENVPTGQHRLALYVSAFATALTEPLLGAALDVEDAREIFDWLGRLSFIEHGPHGLFPHDLARDLLYADSRWRNPDVHRLLSERLLTYLYGRFQDARGIEQQRIWFDVIYMQRHNPSLRPYFVWSVIGTAHADPLRPEDSSQILHIVEQHEGAASKAIAAHWLRRQPDAFVAFRDRSGALIGFMGHVRLEHATAEDAEIDPAVEVLQGFMQRHGPVRPREEVSCLRFMMARDTYQGRSASFNVLAANTSLYWTTHPRLAWSFVAVADADRMEPLFTSLHVWRAPDADFEVDGRRYGVFAHDWRVEPIEAWFRSKVDRAMSCEAGAQSARPEPLLVLSQTDFTDAVRDALREYTRPDRLADNPLLRTRLCPACHGAGIETLRGLLLEAVNALRSNARDQKLHLALWHTFFQPARTQEEVAELLELPFNTYRYQLAKGVERLSEWLWRRELAVPSRTDAGE
jgi:AAA ATPase domain